MSLVENNILDGLDNNIFCNLNTLEFSIKYGVSDYVLISSDKAVKPTNIMGASKRFCEICSQSLYEYHYLSSKTKISIVRFGNVLNSSGSVIPKFREQIKYGGPVTITDENVSRYFMTLTEAAQLVIHASSLAKGGEVFILDMGNPIKILDLAKRMISLSGLSIKNKSEEGDIEIEFIGLKQGEKLEEELFLGDKNGTDHSKIFKAEEPFLLWEKLETKIKNLKKNINENDIKGALQILLEVVENYEPSFTVKNLMKK